VFTYRWQMTKEYFVTEQPNKRQSMWFKAFTETICNEAFMGDQIYEDGDVPHNPHLLNIWCWFLLLGALIFLPNPRTIQCIPP
jgi:hypothetical protein